ncbi:hypothetical protein [Pseudomonas guariconensis]|uniref:hypothetical protein n=1 Tax=Pseudomonas guariconensis TaxID=1288410 RepID=UPI0018A9F959|nr:hypothetical protein [Pseudomonas guariconensis]MBF8722691.1 hypothetical protein [Pseudomonas guariconensis]
MANQQKNVSLASDWHRMGGGYSCRFTIRNGEFHADWSPRFPNPRNRRRIIKAGKYFAARHQFLTKVAENIGGNVLCIGAGSLS